MLGFAVAALPAMPMPNTLLADEPAVESQAYTISRGGQLYDNWWEALGTKGPTTTHPSYPAASEQKGDTTWRCIECHGWDYLGAAGARPLHGDQRHS
jgi:thiosulfate dehydrogenase